MAHVVMAYVVMAYMVIAVYSYGLCSYGSGLDLRHVGERQDEVAEHCVAEHEECLRRNILEALQASCRR